MPSSHIQYANIVIGKFTKSLLVYPILPIPNYAEGVNGLLPNLDLVNVMVYLCHTERVKSAFHDRVSDNSMEPVKISEYVFILVGVARLLPIAGSRAPPRPLHNHFHGYISGCRTAPGGTRPLPPAQNRLPDSEGGGESFQDDWYLQGSSRCGKVGVVMVALALKTDN